MPAVLLGIALLVLLLWGLSVFSKADPRLVLRSLRIAAGVAALLGAALLAEMGRVGAALPIGLGGLALLGIWPGAKPLRRRAQKSPGQVSRVRSAFLEMELDHDSGALRGRILVGRYEGASLEALDVATLAGLLAQIDEESRALLATYLDRREPAWREHTQADPAAGQGGATRSGPMTQEEAYQILGLQAGASADEISRAHRSLMKKLHPDQGGSTYLAARVNEAKEILLHRHR
jgi:DnaJ domain